VIRSYIGRLIATWREASRIKKINILKRIHMEEWQ